MFLMEKLFSTIGSYRQLDNWKLNVLGRKAPKGTCVQNIWKRKRKTTYFQNISALPFQFYITCTLSLLIFGISFSIVKPSVIIVHTAFQASRLPYFMCFFCLGMYSLSPPSSQFYLMLSNKAFMEDTISRSTLSILVILIIARCGRHTFTILSLFCYLVINLI